MTDLPSQPRSLPSQMGSHLRVVDGVGECWLRVSPEICSHGMPLGATLVMLVDVGAGWAAEKASGDDWSFTVDIGIRRDPTITDRIDGIPAVQRAGRTVSIDFPMRDASGAVTATGVSTFIRLPRRPQDPPRPHFPENSMSVWQPADAPLGELLGATPTEGGLRVDLRPELLNPAGILQGGVTALLAELAAQRVDADPISSSARSRLVSAARSNVRVNASGAIVKDSTRRSTAEYSAAGTRLMPSRQD